MLHFYIGDDDNEGAVVNEAEVKDEHAAGAVEKSEVEVVGTSYESNPESVLHFYIGDDDVPNEVPNDTEGIVADDAEITKADAAGAAERWKEVERIEAMLGYPPRRGRKWKRRKKKVEKPFMITDLD